jgi:hypothetical protein
MVGRQHDRRRHRRRSGGREESQPDVPGCAPHRDPGEEVPPEVEAREGCELVGQPRGLEGPVGLRLLRDGIRQRRVCEARRREREEREEEESDRARHEHRVAEQQVPVAPVLEEQDGDRDDHRPVAPDVDPVDEVDDEVEPDHGGLERRLPRQVDGFLEAHDAIGVRVGLRGAADGEVADPEVDERREACEGELHQSVAMARDGAGNAPHRGPHRFIFAPGRVWLHPPPRGSGARISTETGRIP